jgi:hypothetical protein
MLVSSDWMGELSVLTCFEHLFDTFEHGEKV